MTIVFYGTLFAVSLIFSGLYLFIWHKHFDVNFTMIFTLVPVACLGYFLIGQAKSLEGAIYGTQICYIHPVQHPDPLPDRREPVA